MENTSREISAASVSLVGAVTNIPEGLAQVVERVERTHSSVGEMMLAFLVTEPIARRSKTWVRALMPTPFYGTRLSEW